MKRKWIWILAVASLFVGLAFAEQLTDKRPQLVARHVEASNLIISPNGKLLFARSYAQKFGQILDLSDGSRFKIPGDDDAFWAFFSEDGRHIYEICDRSSLNVGGYNVHFEIIGHSTSAAGASKGFVFSTQDYLYGAYAVGNKVVAESSRRNWVLDAHNLRVLNIQKQKRAFNFNDALISPDGKTLFDWRNVKEFVDSQTGKPLWKWPLGSKSRLNFTGDSRLVLRQDNGEVIAHDTRTGVEKWRLRGPQSGLIALSPDEKTLYEARANGELWKWPR